MAWDPVKKQALNTVHGTKYYWQIRTIVLSRDLSSYSTFHKMYVYILYLDMSL